MFKFLNLLEKNKKIFMVVNIFLILKLEKILHSLTSSDHPARTYFYLRSKGEWPR